MIGGKRTFRKVVSLTFEFKVGEGGHEVVRIMIERENEVPYEHIFRPVLNNSGGITFQTSWDC